MSVTHTKNNTISDWTQADLDAQIALGNYPPGTVLADIVLPSDWNDAHIVSIFNSDVANAAAIDSTKIANGSVTNTEFQYLDGVTSSIQTQLDSKQTSVSVSSANGFAGSSSGGTTPDLTLSTTVNGIVKGNGTSLSAATAGTDYLTASSSNTLTNKTFDTAGTGNSLLINGLAATANTGTGSIVRATSPALVTPDLGTPSALVGTNITGTASGLSIGGNSATATTASNVVVADAASDTTTFVMLAGSATGSSLPVLTDAGLTFNASTNALTTTTFVGALTGNADTATTATNFTVANEATDTTCFPLFATAATGTLPPKSNASLTFNSNTGALGATTLGGTLTTAAQTNITSLGTLTGLTMGGTLAMGANNITMTGSLAATGSRVTKGWFTDIESTNAPTVGGSAVYYAGGPDVAVADGGTGRSTGTTAYSLIATGTTATGAQQTLANGATTEILVGGGASALPVWTTSTGTGSPVRATAPTITTPNIVGITSGAAASAGSVGELIESEILSGSAVSLTSPSYSNITSISLTAGQWIIFGNVFFSPNAATTFTTIGAAISSVSASPPTSPGKGAFSTSRLSFTTGALQGLQVGTTTVNISSTTTYYLVAQSTFAVNTMSAYGYIGAIRIR